MKTTETIVTMEDIITKLVELANEYADMAISVEYPNGHNELRKATDYKSEDKIAVYLSRNFNGEIVKSVYFGLIEIFLYSDKITFPYDYDAMKMASIYEDAKDFLNDFKANKLEEMKDVARKWREKQIKQLEKELNELKQLKGI